MSIINKIKELHESLPTGVELVAVSKTHPVEDIAEAYHAGQRTFGESRPQELRMKYDALPKDIRWHMIGPLQTNKVKYIAPFVELIHSVDSERLMNAIDKEAIKNNRTIDVLLEVHVAQEDSKIGWDTDDLKRFLSEGRHRTFGNVRIRGLMTIGSLTDDSGQVRKEFDRLKALFDELRKTYFGSEFDILSMGMTSDHTLAIACGANMVRIGSLIFGER